VSAKRTDWRAGPTNSSPTQCRSPAGALLLSRPSACRVPDHTGSYRRAGMYVGISVRRQRQERAASRRPVEMPSALRDDQCRAQAGEMVHRFSPQQAAGMRQGCRYRCEPRQPVPAETSAEGNPSESDHRPAKAASAANARLIDILTDAGHHWIYILIMYIHGVGHAGCEMGK
jgi:hypothetical protein